VVGAEHAVEEALYSQHASHVTLVHRATSCCEKILQDRLFTLESAGKASSSGTLDRGDSRRRGRRDGVRLHGARGDGGPDIAVDGVFIAVGHQLNTQLFEGQLDMRGGTSWSRAAGR